MSIIDLVKWEPGSRPVYAWRFPETNLSTFTQLLVNESQEAVLFSKGRMTGKFGPGKHTLSTENLPLLRELFGLPFGGKNPFTAEVWFVNKLMPLNIEWETDALRVFDTEYKAMVPLRAQGRYGLRIADAERFLVKLVGTATGYTAEELTDNFKGALVSKTKSVLSQVMQSQGIGVNSISAHLDGLSTGLKAPMAEFWSEFGFDLAGFYVTSVDIDRSTEDGRAIAKAMADQSAQNISGHTWQQQRAMEVAEKALTQGKDMGMMGALLMTGGLMGGNSGVAQELLRPPAGAGQPPTPGGVTPMQQGATRQVFCSNCSRKFPSTAKFCPGCGKQYHPCTTCGADNDLDAARCVTCGARFAAEAGPQGEGCPHCGAPIDSHANFCPSCGKKAR